MRRDSAYSDLKIVYVRERSTNWSRKRLRTVVDRKIEASFFSKIDSRRTALSRLAPKRLPGVYDGAAKGGEAALATMARFSIPPAYGRILYALVEEIKPRLVVEAGAGYGISGMYIGCALSDDPDASFITFEPGEYAAIAEDSVSQVIDNAFVIRDRFERFYQYLDADAEIGFAFFDAVHAYGALRRDTKLIKGWLSPGAMIVLDDVNYSEETRAAWSKIATDRDVDFSALINKRLGVIVYA